MLVRKKPRIFHGLVNYGTQAGYLANCLRAKGYETLSVVSFDPFKREIDIELLHGGNIIQKIFRHSWNYLRKIYWFFRFDIFHFYYGITLFPKQMDLPFYRLFGKKVVMEYLGTDMKKYQASLDKYGEYTNVVDYIRDGKKHDEIIERRYRHEKKYLDLQLVCEPGLVEFVPNAKVLPLALDLNRYPFVPKAKPHGKIRILHAPTNRKQKGTDVILAALDRLEQEGYPIEVVLAEQVSHQRLKELYIECDLFIDQILAGWYGTASIEAMAIGRPVVCYYRENYIQHEDYGEEIPLINANRFNLYETLVGLIERRDQFPEWGRRSRAFVEKVHDLEVVSEKLLQLYRAI